MEEKSYLTSNDYRRLYNAYLVGLEKNNPSAYKQMKKAESLFNGYLNAKDDKRKKHSLYKLQKFLRKQKDNKKVKKVYNISAFEAEVDKLSEKFSYYSTAKSDLDKIVSKIKYDEEHPADALKYLFNEYRDQVEKEKREKEEQERRIAEKEERAKQRRSEEAKVARQSSLQQQAYEAEIEANRLRMQNEREEEEARKRHEAYLREHPNVVVKSGKFKFVSTTSIELPNPQNDAYTVNEERAKKLDETIYKLANSINMEKKDEVHKLRFALMGHTNDILVSNGRNAYRGIEDYLEIKEKLLNSHDKLSLEAKDLMELSNKVIVALYDECLIKADLKGHREYNSFVSNFSAEELLNDYRNKYNKYYKRFRRANASEKQEIANVLGDEGRILSPEQVVDSYKQKIVRRLCTREGNGYYEENYLENVSQKDYFELFINANNSDNMMSVSTYIVSLLKDFTPEEIVNVYNAFMGSVNKDWVIGSNQVRTDEDYETYKKRKEVILKSFANAYGSRSDIDFNEAMDIVSGNAKAKSR